MVIVTQAQLSRLDCLPSVLASMTHGQSLENVRRFVRRCFDRLGANVNESICESLLVCDGHYCGRRFVCGGFSAVWFVEENEVKLYDREGGLLYAAQASEHGQQRAAA